MHCNYIQVTKKNGITLLKKGCCHNTLRGAGADVRINIGGGGGGGGLKRGGGRSLPKGVWG